LGQIGTELALTLIDRYGRGNIVLSDIRPLDNSRKKSGNGLFDDFPYYRIDCRDRKALSDIVKQYKFSRIYHLAALLSATSEKNPQTAWDINVTGLCNILELARETGCEVFTPSSIAAFGPTTIRDFTPQDTTQRPTSIYGISKVTGELLCDYYYHKYGVDTRGVRYPGIISSLTPPGGGTTDYAVEIFYAAVKEKRYVCPLRDDTRLDMMYMPDAVKAAVDIMEADPERLPSASALKTLPRTFGSISRNSLSPTASIRSDRHWRTPGPTVLRIMQPGLNGDGARITMWTP
jgi:nucleoside-diphosphate-sugar epimerase